MIVRLHHIPVDEIAELKEAYDNGNWNYLIQKWNDYRLTTDPLCYCMDGVEKVQLELPKLWKSEGTS